MCDKEKHIHKRQTHLLVRENVTLGVLTAGVQLKKSLVIGLKGLDAKTK
jgi:hypothetical protein